MNVLEHLIYALRNAPVNHYPYPHFYAENVFDWNTYDAVQEWLDTCQSFRPLDGGYAHRTFTDEMPDILKPLDSPKMGQHMIQKFSQQYFERYPNSGRPNLSHEWRFIRDEEQYSIGPHTDSPRKVLSLLFYMPTVRASDLDLGTGVYVPDDGKKTCAGGPHYPFDGFSEVFRAPYMANSCFGFWKTSNSWHGVEPIPRKVRRDVLLYNIYEEKKEKSPIFVAG